MNKSVLALRLQSAKRKVTQGFSALRHIESIFAHLCAQLKIKDKRVKQLLEENKVLRMRLQASLEVRKITHKEMHYIFPVVEVTPEEILKHNIVDLLPIVDDTDLGMRICKTRIIGTLENMCIKTPEELFAWTNSIRGPNYMTLLMYRRFGLKSLQMLSATLTHYGLRHRSLLRGNKDPYPELTFPSIDRTPEKILDASIEDILPERDTLDHMWRTVRSRVIHMLEKQHIWTVRDLLSSPQGHGLHDSEWRSLQSFRGIGSKCHYMLREALNHHGVKFSHYVKGQ